VDIISAAYNLNFLMPLIKEVREVQRGRRLEKSLLKGGSKCTRGFT
jgi:hypothetical protein